MNLGWNTRIEDLLILWVKQMNLNRMKHERKARCNMNLHILFGIPNILLTTIASFLLMGSLRLSKDSIYGEIFTIVISIIVLTSATLSAMQIFFNFGQKSEKHKQASLLYRSISSRIDATLLLYRKDRPDVKQFLQMVQTEFNNISNYSPMIFANPLENDLPNYTLAMQILDKNYNTFNNNKYNENNNENNNKYNDNNNKNNNKYNENNNKYNENNNKYNENNNKYIRTHSLPEMTQNILTTSINSEYISNSDDGSNSDGSLDRSLESMDSMESIDPVDIYKDVDVNYIINNIECENDYISINIESSSSDNENNNESSDGSSNADSNYDSDDSLSVSPNYIAPLLRKNSINDDLLNAAKYLDNKNQVQKMLLKKYIDINSAKCNKMYN